MNRINAVTRHAIPLLLAAAASVGGAQPRPAAPCCAITAIDARTGVISAKETASGKTFEFKARNPMMVATLKVGQGVYANFATNQVSLDGRTVCCTLTSAPTSTTPVKGQPLGIPIGRVATLPQVTYGTPVPAQSQRVTGPLPRVSTRTVSANVRGRQVTQQILELNGRQGIKNANLPDGVKRLLEMHVRKLPIGASQYYLVQPELAAKWAATHPVPADVKPKDANESDSDCGTVSVNGFVDCAQDAGQAVQDAYEHARQQAESWWNESTTELAKALNEAPSCFADQTLPGPTVPVKFNISPSMTVDASKSTTKNGVTGTVTGAVTLGVPLESNIQAQTEFFYIPCLPFVFRPKRIVGDGSVTVGQKLSVDVTATASFENRYTIPPTGGPQIPLYVIPIIIGDVPVAELDVSAYIEGDVQVKADGKATGKFAMSTSQTSTFSFDCSGGGCSGRQRGTSTPIATNESAQIEGQVTATPGLYTALQLSLDYNVLQGRVGPEPYLKGVANGCAGVSMQSSGTTSSSTTNAVLAADLDWGAKIRAEALAAGQRVGNRWEEKLMDDRHIWFGDLAPGGSSALVATLTATAPTAAPSQPLGVKVKMPSCYPYTDLVSYRVTWTGTATPAPNPACQWQSGGGTCHYDPMKDLGLTLTWQTPGSQSLTVQLVRDDHRVFSPAPAPAKLTINVGT